MKIVLIKDKEVSVSQEYPDFGVTRDGEVFRISSGRKVALSKHGGKADQSDPYYAFRVNTGGKKFKKVYLHKFVAMCWLENDDPVNKTQVNHKDGNKLNPVLDNLEWVTPSQNQRHALRNGLKQIGQDLYNSKLSEELVHAICLEFSKGVQPKSVSIKYDIPLPLLYKLKSGDTYFHIRKLYKIPMNYKNNFTRELVESVCRLIVEGFSDINISKILENKISKIEVNRIRNKIRYSDISDNFF